MVRINWESQGAVREFGVDHAFLFPAYGGGVPWPGLVGMTQKPIPGEELVSYYDGQRYINERGLEDLEYTLDAITTPNEMDQLTGVYEIIPGVVISQQERESFALTFRTMVEAPNGHIGYKIHILYDAMALSPSVEYVTVDDDPNVPVKSWPLVLVPKHLKGYAPTMYASIDSTKAGALNFQEFQRILYGENDEPPYLMNLSELQEFFKYDLTSLRIEHEPEYGLSDLVETPPYDLIGPTESGIYWKSSNSRLTETENKGLYDLE